MVLVRALWDNRSELFWYSEYRHRHMEECCVLYISSISKQMLKYQKNGNVLRNHLLSSYFIVVVISFL